MHAERPPNAGKGYLRLSTVAAGLVLLLALGWGIRETVETWQAESRRPDRVEVLSAVWDPAGSGAVRMRVRLSRADGRRFDPQCGITLRNLQAATSQFHYFRGWKPRSRPLPSRTLEFAFSYRVSGGLVPEDPTPVRIDGWSRPRLFTGWRAWVARIPGAAAVPGLLRPPMRNLTILPYPLEGGSYTLPPGKPRTRTPGESGL